MGSSLSHFFEGKCPPSRIVETKYGPVVGRRIIHEGEQQVDAFQGIPYAAPPTGSLRFAHPQPPSEWNEPRHCTTFGPRGIQNDALFITKIKLGHVSEDNLYVNVFTPVWTPPSPNGFPVMVFIHGGGFVSDSTVKYGDIGISKHLCTKNVVVVTLQYRLGYLGFWTTNDEECPDNLALWDMTFALQWVQDNIQFFNGDKDNVTLFGQSAGGASVDLLSLSPHSRDLFHKVIPMAGNASCEWSINHNSFESCREIASKAGVDYTDSQQYISELRKLDAMKFATSLKINAGSKEVQTEIGPRFDGKFFPKPIDELRKEAPGKPRILGCCRFEGLIMMIMDNSATIDKIEQLIAQMIPEEEFDDFRTLRTEILNKVIDLKEEHHDKEQLQRTMAEIYGDLFLNIGTQKCVIDCLEKGDSPVYFYSFDYYNPKSWGLLRFKMPFKDSTHCTELSYIFAVGIIADYKFTDTDMVMLERVTKMWTNFAKYSNPNGCPSEPSTLLPFQWEPSSLDNPQRHLSISLHPQMMDIYHNGRPMWWLETRKTKKSICSVKT